MFYPTFGLARGRVNIFLHMEPASFFLTQPLCYLFIGLVTVAFVLPFFLKKLAWICFACGVLALTGFVIFGLLNGAGYLDIGLVTVPALILLIVGVMVSKRKEEPNGV